MDFLRKLFSWALGKKAPNDHFIEDLLFYHNKLRDAQGIKPLKLNHQLVAAAQKYAKWLDDHHRLTHEGNGNPGERIKKEGYHWNAYSENIDCGCETPTKIIIKWMKHKHQRSILMSDKYCDVGFGRAGKYWCVIYATKSAS